MGRDYPRLNRLRMLRDRKITETTWPRCCSQKLGEPDIVDGTAYFICEKCGNVIEVENFRIYSDEEVIAERLEQFEAESGFKLPSTYLDHIAGTGRIVVLPPLEDNASDKAKYYLGDTYEFHNLSGLREKPAVFDSLGVGSTVKGWGVPDGLIGIDGSGHVWLCLDYRVSTTDPKVILIETSEFNELVIAQSFDDFVKMIRPYSEVFDPDANRVDN